MYAYNYSEYTYNYCRSNNCILEIQGQLSFALLCEHFESKSVCGDEYIHNGMPLAITLVGSLLNCNSRKQGLCK